LADAAAPVVAAPDAAAEGAAAGFSFFPASWLLRAPTLRLSVGAAADAAQAPLSAAAAPVVAAADAAQGAALGFAFPSVFLLLPYSGAFLLVLQMRLLSWLLPMLLSWLLPMLLLKVRLWASPFVPLVAAALRGLWCLQVRLLLLLWLLVMPRQPRIRLRPLILAFSFEFRLRRERVAAIPAIGLRLPASETRKGEPILSQ